MRPIYFVLDDGGGPPLNHLPQSVPFVAEVVEAVAQRSGAPTEVVYFPVVEFEELVTSMDFVNWRTIADRARRWTDRFVLPRLQAGVSVVQLGSLASLLIGYGNCADVAHAAKAFRPVTPDATAIVMDKFDFPHEVEFNDAKDVYWAYRAAFLGGTGRYVICRQAWVEEVRSTLEYRAFRPRRWGAQREPNKVIA
jgi:hypothetical protein